MHASCSLTPLFFNNIILLKNAQDEYLHRFWMVVVVAEKNQSPRFTHVDKQQTEVFKRLYDTFTCVLQFFFGAAP
jgi:hypothetical protein